MMKVTESKFKFLKRWQKWKLENQDNDQQLSEDFHQKVLTVAIVESKENRKNQVQ